MITVYKTTLTNKKLLTGNVYFFTFRLIDPPEINFIPGQYLILKIQGKLRAYSIASSNKNKNFLEFIIEFFPGGLASTYLKNLKIGERVDFQGPIGQFTLKENNKQKIFLVTGTGIAPVRSIFISNIKNQILKTEIKNQKFKFNLFWGQKTYNDVYLLDELKQLNNEIIEQFSFKICLSREQNFDKIPEKERKYFDFGHVDSCFFKDYKNLTSEQLNNYEFYLCGGRTIVDSLRQGLIDKGVLIENIIFEKF